MTADRIELDCAIAALLRALEGYFNPKPMQKRVSLDEVETLYERVNAEIIVYSQKLLQEKPSE